MTSSSDPTVDLYWFRKSITNRNPPPSLEENAGFFSRILFLWLNPLLTLGNQRSLNANDLPALAYENNYHSPQHFWLNVHIIGSVTNLGRFSPKSGTNGMLVVNLGSFNF